jgi:hypothetical protein
MSEFTDIESQMQICSNNLQQPTQKHRVNSERFSLYIKVQKIIHVLLNILHTRRVNDSVHEATAIANSI